MITQKELKRLLHYDQDTGFFTRKVRTSNNTAVGKICGCNNGKGYLKISLGNKPYYAHRLVFLYLYGTFPEFEVDHINHNRSDNRIENLREVSVAENRRNASMQRDNTSGHLGVYRNKPLDMWEARIRVDGKFIYLGIFNTKEDAISVREKANSEYDFHINHGNP